MPRYFFDLTENGRRFQDDDGTKLSDDDAARDETLRTLGERARDILPDEDHHDIVIEVTDDAQRPVLKANLQVRVEYPKRN